MFNKGGYEEYVALASHADTVKACHEFPFAFFVGRNVSRTVRASAWEDNVALIQH